MLSKHDEEIQSYKQKNNELFKSNNKMSELIFKLEVENNKLKEELRLIKERIANYYSHKKWLEAEMVIVTLRDKIKELDQQIELLETKLETCHLKRLP